MTVLSPARGYALWAPTYDETAVSALESQVVNALEVPLRGRRLLDAGCGIARRLGETRDAGASIAFGVDLAPAMLARAHGSALVAAADVRALPVADGGFDVVWCRLVLGYLAELETAYSELARACRPGGLVLATDFHPAATAAGHRRTFRDGAGELRELESHLHDVGAHRKAATGAGLTLRDRRDGVVGDGIRGFYARAGRLDAFEQQRGLPLVLAMLFARDE